MTGMTKEEGIKQVYNGGGHVVILGAGASIALSKRNPVAGKKKLPSMDDFIEIVGLTDIIENIPKELRNNNFEKLYANLHLNTPHR